MLVPLKYINQYLNLPSISPSQLAEKLTYHGLETNLVEKNKEFFLALVPLPNRPDLLSWWGIVQEIGIILNCQVKPFNFSTINESKEKLIEVKITTNECWKFFLNLIESIEIKESPHWIKNWLEVNNIRSINNVVDSANLVMLESGQPIHIFDYNSLPEKKMVVRQAQPGEKISTLQGKELTLNSEDIIISSGDKIISLAGIIGDRTTATNFQTKNILIECASFNPQIIKKTAKRLNIITAASHFFSRSANLILSPQQILARIISLIRENYQYNLNSPLIFSYRKEEKIPLIITISQEFINKKVGQKFAEQTIENIWQQLKFSYQKERNIYHITIPLSRPDITIAEDLLEELLRIYDYNKIISSLP
ncbi:MAG: hypothetical protein I3275_06530 [Candidatus Moeniiplasma glomeromycotorum]|nr:hypothetical protein [Candidatus Moeniiplasma glomeromycotorum]MCE8168242.1 hypothetical protein [Candidatus Moeniiplasma glomeromycotorum]